MTHPAVVEFRLEVHRLDELQLQQARDEEPGHLDAGLQVLEGPDDALQVARWLAVLGEKGNPVRGTDARMIEVDRNVGPVRVERYALQAERPVELQIAPFLEKQILARDRTPASPRSKTRRCSLSFEKRIG